jgi:hypothetical protein
LVFIFIELSIYGSAIDLDIVRRRGRSFRESREYRNNDSRKTFLASMPPSYRFPERFLVVFLSKSTSAMKPSQGVHPFKITKTLKCRDESLHFGDVRVGPLEFPEISK